MARFLTSCSVFVAAFIVIVTANDECTYIRDTQDGCTVDKGHAVCEPKDLNSSVHGIPSCVTWITLSLQKLDLTITPDWKVIFASLESLPLLKKLSITVNQEKYEIIPIVQLENQHRTLNYPNLEILQINADSDFVYGSAWSVSFQSLQVLDFTRSKVGIVNARRFCKTLPAVQKLILRNIQAIKDKYDNIPSVKLADFVCIGNVRYLDLSYNDIAFISLVSMCWNIKLQVLNLDHNILASIYTPDQDISNLLSYLQTIPQLKTLNVNYCSSITRYHKGLWDDDENRTDLAGLQNENEKMDHYFESNLVDKIIHTPLSLFAGYEYWLRDMMKHCGNIRYKKLVKCTMYYADACQFFNCIAPDFNITICQERKIDQAFAQFSRQFCD